MSSKQDNWSEPIRNSIMCNKPFRLMVVSRSQMGKTTLMIKLMAYYWLKYFHKVYIFCPTFHQDKKWAAVNKFVKAGLIKVYYTVDSMIIKDIWNKNKTLKDDILIYFDDCVGQKDFKINNEQGIINQLVSKGNHANISTIWVVQKFTQCSTIMRVNAEAMITFYVQSDDEKKYIWKEFGVGSFKNFKKMLDHCTEEKYHYLFCNRQGPGRPDYYHNFKYVVYNKDDA